MTQRTDSVGAFVGASMAVGPAAVTPFYETEWWMGAVAVLGMAVLVLSLVNAILTLRAKRRRKK